MKRFLAFAGLAFSLAACASESRQFEAEPTVELDLNAEEVSSTLAKATTYETTWSQDAKVNTNAFYELHAFLEESFPLVHEHLRRERINELSLLYIWEGSNPSLEPILLLSHIDVVPADQPEKWDFPPFGGTYDDKYIYGRGTIDVKYGVIGKLEAAEHLLRQGFKPERGIIFAFGHDEELMGTRGGEEIAKWLAKEGFKIDFILDEGPAVLPGIVPGLDKEVAFVGTAARGNAYFELSVDTNKGGHASLPPVETPISILSTAIAKATAHDYEARLTQPLTDMMIYLGPEMPFAQQIAYSNPSLFAPLFLDEYAKVDGGRAVTRTTIVPTIFKAGDKDATVPDHAKAVVAMGFLPGETIAGAKEKLRSIIDDDRVEIGFVHFPDNNRAHAYDPTPIAPVDYWAFYEVQRSVHQVFPEAVVAPTLMPGGSDGKHYVKAGVTDKIYYFYPINVTNEEIETMHGVNERLPVEAYLNAIRFYAQLFKNVQR